MIFAHAIPGLVGFYETPIADGSCFLDPNEVQPLPTSPASTPGFSTTNPESSATQSIKPPSTSVEPTVSFSTTKSATSATQPISTTVRTESTSSTLPTTSPTVSSTHSTATTIKTTPLPSSTTVLSEGTTLKASQCSGNDSYFIDS